MKKLMNLDIHSLFRQGYSDGLKGRIAKSHPELNTQDYQLYASGYRQGCETRRTIQERQL